MSTIALGGNFQDKEPLHQSKQQQIHDIHDHHQELRSVGSARVLSTHCQQEVSKPLGFKTYDILILYIVNLKKSGRKDYGIEYLLALFIQVQVVEWTRTSDKCFMVKKTPKK